MNGNLKQILKNVLLTLANIMLSINIRISKTTVDRQRILDFLAYVKPVKTNHELIRIGCDTDGGYLVPNDLENVEICFSPGVSKVAAFEADLTKKGIKCFLADYSVQAPPISNSLIYFEKKYIGVKESEVFMTLENWVSRHGENKSDLILQMDIEGAEYGVLIDASSETLRKFRIMIIEFHYLDNLSDRIGFQLIDLAFAKILKDFEVVHIHPNNNDKPVNYKGVLIPPLMEFTFLRKDRISYKSDFSSFPHELDRKNVANYTDFALPECWYKHVNPTQLQL